MAVDLKFFRLCRFCAAVLIPAFLLAGCKSTVKTYNLTAERSSVETSAKSSRRTESDSKQQKNSNTEKASAPMVIYVCGAVRRPGVYRLESGARVYQALQAAGGLTGQADEKSLNQAAPLEDGQQVVVYTKEEIGKGAGGAPASGNSGTASSSSAAAKVNLNTADKEALMTLNGIGEARAEAILTYRQNNGRFRTVEDIMKVEGIKEKAFEKIKNQIEV